MIRISNLLCILLYCFSTAKCEPKFRYHESVGVPRALALRISEVKSRIVGGSPADAQSSFPYQVGIIATLTTGWTSVCGGSLVSRNRILTAAHCWWDGQSQARKFTIVLGSLKIFSGGTRIDTTDVVIHPSWNTLDITHDIAIVKIPAVNFNNNIQPVQLPALSDVNQMFSGMTAIASGYGKISDAQTSFPTTSSLHRVSLTIITNAHCQKSFDVSIHGSHLCTAGDRGVGTCDGDSGGPLTVVWKNSRTLVGIVSFGLGNGCEKGLPSVYTRVTAFLTWINANM
ncbi:chymotrypsin-1-like [Battus philenor]|uniref:chymotrypsin-1-like n=1 Tax=Battus philenor TaxID=42288 RepID=UPI0035D0F33C